MRKGATKKRDKARQNEDKGGRKETIEDKKGGNGDRKETRVGRRLYLLSIKAFYCMYALFQSFSIISVPEFLYLRSLY